MSKNSSIPIDYRNEQTILGNALNFTECLEQMTAFADWDDFLEKKHKVIAWCCITMQIRQLEISDDSFNLVLAEHPNADKGYGGNTYLAKLKSICPTQNLNYLSHIEKLKADSVKYQVSNTSVVQLYQSLSNPSVGIEDLVQQLDSIKSHLEVGRSQNIDFDAANSIAERYLELLELRRQPGGTFVTSGIDDIDEYLTEGFAPGLVSVIAGFTGCGKSSLVDNMSIGQIASGKKVGIVSLEMIAESHFDRICSILTNIPLLTIIKEINQLTGDENALLLETVEKLKGLGDKFLINDKAVVSLSDVDLQLSLLSMSGRCPDIIYIDLFGKLDDVSVEANLAQTIERKLRICRAIARKHQVHISVVVQIRRFFDMSKLSKSKKIPRPTLDKIKNSGAFAEEADLVLLPHRNKYYIPELDYDILEILVAKQRQGAMNKRIYLGFEDVCTRILPTNQVPHDSNFN